VSNRHVGPIWLIASFLDDFVLIYPTYAIMMLEGGMSGTGLSVLLAAWSLSALLFEVPSGVIGDLLNRKRYLAVGSFIRASGYICWLLAPGWTGYLLGFLLWSLGSAIHSGTMQALLHDILHEQDRLHEFPKLHGRGVACGSIGVLLAMAAGGYAAQSGYTAVLVLSAVAPACAGLLLLFGITEPARSGAQSTARPLATLRAAAGALTRSRSLLLPVAMCIAFTGVAGVVDEYVGPLLNESSLDLGPIGLLYGAILGARALGAALAHRLRRLSLSQLGWISLLAHGVLLCAQFGATPVLAAGFAAYFAVLGAVGVLLETEVQRRIDVGARATVGSLAGAGVEVWGICLFLLIGAVADRSSWATAIATAAAVAVLLAGVLAYVAGPVTERSRS
jgi:MFS family permease